MSAESTDTNAAAFDPAADDVFARIAGRYDRLCDIFSLFAHRIWKARIASRMAAEAGSLALDVASGPETSQCACCAGKVVLRKFW